MVHPDQALHWVTRHLVKSWLAAQLAADAATPRRVEPVVAGLLSAWTELDSVTWSRFHECMVMLSNSVSCMNPVPTAYVVASVGLVPPNHDTGHNWPPHMHDPTEYT